MKHKILYILAIAYWLLAISESRACDDEVIIRVCECGQYWIGGNEHIR